MTRVWIAASTAVLRKGLEGLIAPWPDLALAGSGAALSELTGLGDIADVAVWEWTDHEAAVELGLPDEAPPLLVLAAEPEGPWVAEALRGGVRGVLPLEASSEELHAAIQAVAAGLVVLTPAGLATGSTELRSGVLTTRETEVLRLLAEGTPNKLIAYRLGISEHTVKFHLNSLFTKLHVNSRTEAVTAGIRQGLLTL